MAKRIRSLEITLISAKDLQDINLISKMDLYAVITVSGDPNNAHPKVYTGVDRACGTNATWNFAANFTIDESLIRSNRLNLSVSLVCSRNLGDREIGGVNVPVNDLLSSVTGDSNSIPKFVSYQVTKPNGTAKGELNFSFKFGETKIADEFPIPENPIFPNLYPYPAPTAGYNGDYYEQEQPAQQWYTDTNPIWSQAPDLTYPYPPRGSEFGYVYPPTQPWNNGDVAYDLADSRYDCSGTSSGCSVAGCGCQGVDRFDFR